MWFDLKGFRREKKDSGWIISLSPYSCLMARLSSYTFPYEILSVHKILTFVPEAEEKIQALLKTEKRNNYVKAICSCYPERRFILKQRLDAKPKRATFSALPGFLKDQFNVDSAQFKIAILHANSGKDFDPDKETVAFKDLLFCGASLSEIIKIQDQFIALGLIPIRLEIGTLGILNAFSRLQRTKEQTAPLLTIEIGLHSTQMLIFKNGQLEAAHLIGQGLKQFLSSEQSATSQKEATEIPQKEEATEESEKEAKPQDKKETLLQEFLPLEKLSSTADTSPEVQEKMLYKFIPEIKFYVGFYEMLTGISIENIYFHTLPEPLNWLKSIIAGRLEKKLYNITTAEIEDLYGIKFPLTDIPLQPEEYLELISLIPSYV